MAPWLLRRNAPPDLGPHQDSGLLKGADKIYIQPGFRWGHLGAAVEKKLESRPCCRLAVWSAIPSQLPFSVYKADLKLGREWKIKHTGASEQNGSWGGK